MLLTEDFWVFSGAGVAEPFLKLTVPLVETFCSSCKARKPHNPCSDRSAPHSVFPAAPVLCIPLQCQGCKRAMVVFLVTRRKTKEGVGVKLTGRSIFEEVEVPDFIPASQEKFYSQALIAFNSGQTLPALFMLRTLIEQYMRAELASSAPADANYEALRGDALCDKYADLLDGGFKQEYPSLKDVYGKLSGALHRADANESLFESEIQRTRLHFQAKKLRVEARKLKAK